MKTRLILTMVFLLLASFAALGQSSRADNAAANQSWPTFWRQITAAVNRKDSVALTRMMPKDFSDGGGGLTPSEWLKFINQNERNGSWRDLQKSFRQGTVIDRKWSAKGPLTRVTRDKGYYFEFRKDKRWYFAGVVGD